MIINITPIHTDGPQPVVSLAGDVLTIDGEGFDLSPLSDGGRLPPVAVNSPWIVRDEITRENGEIAITLLLPIGADAPEASRFPEPIHVDADGPVTLPPYSAEDAA